MSEMGNEGQGSEQDIDSQGQTEEIQNDTGINPAWQELLDVLPSQLHSQVTPHLQKWDKNYQDGIGKVHSQYEPYKAFIDQKVEPDQINYALQVLNAIETRPEEVMAAMQEYYGLGQNQQQNEQQVQQEQQGQESELPVDISNHPEFQRIAQMVDTMAKLTVQQTSAQQQAQADKELEAEFAAAKEKFGDFDEKWVLTQVLSGDAESITQAAEMYQQFEQSILAKHNKPGPRVLSSGGGQAPNQSVDASKLDDKGRRNLIASMLAEAAQQNG